jgi:hypothetical protein
VGHSKFTSELERLKATIQLRDFYTADTAKALGVEDTSEDGIDGIETTVHDMTVAEELGAGSYLGYGNEVKF